MSINDETLTMVRAARLALDATVDAATQALAAAWSSAWEEIATEWAAAVHEVVAMSADGQWPSREVIQRAQRATQALQHTAAQLEALTQHAGVTITGDLRGLAALAEQWDRTIAQTQLPDTGMSLVWGRANPEAINAIVTRSTQQVESLVNPLSTQQQAVMKTTLIRGVAVGENPLDTAQLMIDRLKGAFNGGLHRAEVIARTEMLDAWRAAATETRNAHSSVLSAVMWSATKSDRTCAACLALDGTKYPLGTPGPIDHQCGRCCFIPVTKTWKELGLDGIPEPMSTYQTGREWFDQQPEKVQARIMGTARLDQLQSGALSWDQIPQIRHNSAWRDSIGVRPLAA